MRKQLASFRSASVPKSLWTQEKVFHHCVWEQSIEDILNLLAGTTQYSKAEKDKFAGQILPPSVVHQASVTLVSCPPLWMSGSQSKHLEVTKQGDPENLRRKFASKGSSPRHLCIEQALNLADRYRRVGRLSTCGCIQYNGLLQASGIPGPLLPHPGQSSSARPLRVRSTGVQRCESSGRHPGPPPLRIIPTTSVSYCARFQGLGHPKSLTHTNL